MSNNYTEIRAKNSLSTDDQPLYTINLLQSGYLVQQSITNLSNNDPVVLGCSVTMTNRTVSMLANMTITCDRNSANGELGEQTMIVKLPINGFDYSSAIVNNTSINTSSPTISIPITMTSPRIVQATVASVKNLNYIPNLNSSSNFVSNSISSVDVITVRDSIQKIVGKSSVSPALFVPNDAFDITNVTSSRNVIKSGEYTNITLNYPTLLGTSQHIMQITLPNGQNTYINGVSGCYVGVAQDPCSFIDSNASDIRINLKPNSTVLLTKLLNSYPNTNSLRVRIYTSPEQQLVEEGYTNVQPAIALEKIQITGRAVSSKVADSNVISL